MQQIITRPNFTWNARALHAALMILPLCLIGCADDNKTDPPPANTFDLTVNLSGSGSVISSPAGIDCGSDCTENYTDGTSVTLTATPGGNEQFSGWQGACSGTQTTCTVLMTEARSVMATFASPPIPNAFCDSVGYSTEKFNLTVPYCLDMRDDDYLRYPDDNPVAIANGDALVSNELTGSYDGEHAAKFVPPTTEDYAGLGNFNFMPGSVGNRMNVRYLVYWGYDSVQSGVKLNIMNDGVSTRPMVISREMRSGQNTTYPHDYMIPIPSQNVNEAPVINDPGYPNNPSFFIAGRSVTMMEGNYAHQWVCWEFEIITGGTAPVLNFYVHTRNGVIAYGPGNPYATHAWDAGAIDLVRASIGWYWGPRWTQSAEAYVKISDVVISNSYIGPPAGFLE